MQALHQNEPKDLRLLLANDATNFWNPTLALIASMAFVDLKRPSGVKVRHLCGSYGTAEARPFKTRDVRHSFRKR